MSGKELVGGFAGTVLAQRSHSRASCLSGQFGPQGAQASRRTAWCVSSWVTPQVGNGCDVASEYGGAVQRPVWRQPGNSLAVLRLSGSVHREEPISAGDQMPSNTRTTSLRPRLTREDVLDCREVGELLHLPVSTVLEYARRGLLPGHKLGRRWIFLRDEIEAAVRGQMGGNAAA